MNSCKRKIRILLSLAFVVLVIFVLNSLAYAELYMSISGYVKDADTGNGIAGVQVVATKETEPKEIHSTTTDSSGGFVLKYVPSGTYDLYIDSPSSYVTYVTNNNSNKITVDMGRNVVGLSIRLEKGGSISGKIYQQDGVTPVKGALVVASTAEDNVVFETTNNNGEYVISRLKETSSCKVVVLPDGYGGLYKKDVSVLRGQRTAGVDFILNSDLSTGVTGSITDPAGTGIANATVLVFGSNGGGKATTDSSGKFSILGLAAGTYNAFAMVQAHEALEKKNIQVITGELSTVDFSLSTIESGIRALDNINKSGTEKKISQEAHLEGEVPIERHYTKNCGWCENPALIIEIRGYRQYKDFSPAFPVPSFSISVPGLYYIIQYFSCVPSCCKYTKTITVRGKGPIGGGWVEQINTLIFDYWWEKYISTWDCSDCDKCNKCS